MSPEVLQDGLTVVAHGSTIEEATEAGLRALNLPRSHVSVQVVSKGQGWNLFRRKADAVVRLTASPEIDGAIGILNGQVQVRAPLGPGIPARITPTEGVTVLVDGVPLTEEAVVWPTQVITLQVEAQMADRDRLTLEVAPDGMSVSVRVNALGSYQIADAPMAAQLKPHLTLSLGTTVTVQEIEQALEARGVTYGIDQAAIAEAVARADGQSVVVARGTPMVPGIHGHLRWLATAPSSEHDPEERVNHLERYKPLTVEAETRLAVAELPVQGQPGRTVFDEEVPAPVVDEFRVVAGPGVRLEDDGTVIATIAGRPAEVLRSRYAVVKVMPVYVHQGNVDRSSGNLHVKGDLIITGDVSHSMQVTAGGNIMIMGHVTQATVKARGAVKIHGNCIASSIVSGRTQAFFAAVIPRLAELDDLLSSIIKVIGELMSAPGFKADELDRKGLGPVLQVLVERRFPGLMSLSRSLADLVRELDDPEDDLVKLFEKVLQSKLLGGRLFEVRTLSELADAKYLLGRVRETMALDAEAVGDISLPYCEQSTIRSQGSIRVTGRGSYRSRLVARTRIEVKEAVVGGMLRTGEALELARVGSELGVATHLEVTSMGNIRARTAFPNTHVHVGKRQYVVQEQTPIRAFLTDSGDLRVTR